MINYYISEAEESNDQKLQLARGLFMLMHLEQLKDADWSHVAFQIVSAINILYKAADIKPLDPTHQLMEFLVSSPIGQMVQLVTRIH